MIRRALLLLLLTCAPAAWAQGPDAAWRTLRTPHFRVHYAMEYEAWSRAAASRLESIRAAVVKEVGFDPPQITDILIGNPIAESNGETFPLLDSPRIIFFSEPPEPESTIGEYHDWIDLLETHEMAHLVHMLRPSRNPFERMLERYVPLDPITLRAPRWVLEGYATVVEGRLTGSGRPNGSLRAAILRKWAAGGRLPTYGQLNASRAFLGSSMAYLAGSAFLEWLDARSGPESFPKLWARLTARRRRTFAQAFEGVYGDSPERLYGRFVAELTDHALAIERSEGAAKREGELWQVTERNSGQPNVSPDGSKLVMVLRDAKHEEKLVIYSTGPNENEAKAAKEIASILKRDPQDVAPVRTKPLARKPLHTYMPPEGGNLDEPRWTANGKSIVFGHRMPDKDGFLHNEIFVWTPEEHRVRRLTHRGDVHDASPYPDGQRLIAVRSRYGWSQIVNVNRLTGAVTPVTQMSIERVYSHPVTDGTRVAWSEHDARGWHVVVDGKPIAVDGAFAPELARDGTLYAAVATRGFVDIAKLDANGATPVTHTLGAAIDPAPAPDRSLYFMSLDPDGFVVRKLDAATQVPPLSLAETLPPSHPMTVVAQELPPSKPYGIGRQEWATIVSGNYAPALKNAEYGIRIGDVIGRLDAIAIASFGDLHGGALAVEWDGWPVGVRVHGFHTHQLHGAEVRGLWRYYDFTLDGGGVFGTFHRGFLDASYRWKQRHARETLRLFGDSDHHAQLRARAASKLGALEFDAARRVTLGGVQTSIIPDGAQFDRIFDPALREVASGERYRGARAELHLGALTAFFQRHSLGTTFRVEGVEAAMSAPPNPILKLPALDITLGAARVVELHKNEVWIGLRYRP